MRSMAIRPYDIFHNPFKVRKSTKIRYRYNQAPHQTQDTNGKVATSQLDITNKRQEVSPFKSGDHKASINRRARKHIKNKTEITDPRKNNRIGTVSKNILLEGFNRLHATPTSPLVPMLFKTHICLICIKCP